MKVLLTLTIFNLAICYARAQNGVIVGKVIDELGCTVYLANVEVQSEKELLGGLYSNRKGVFEIIQVPNGTYEVLVEHPDFTERLALTAYISTRQRRDSLVFRLQKRIELNFPTEQSPCNEVYTGICLNCCTRLSLGPNPPLFSRDALGNETTILAEDLERMPR